VLWVELTLPEDPWEYLSKQFSLMAKQRRNQALEKVEDMDNSTQDIGDMAWSQRQRSEDIYNYNHLETSIYPK